MSNSITQDAANPNRQYVVGQPGTTSAWPVGTLLDSTSNTDVRFSALAPAGSTRGFQMGDIGGNMRWVLRANGTPEAGGNSGSDLELYAVADNGQNVNFVFQVTRSNGNVNIPQQVAVKHLYGNSGTVSLSNTSNVTSVSVVGNDLSGQLVIYPKTGIANDAVAFTVNFVTPYPYAPIVMFQPVNYFAVSLGDFSKQFWVDYGVSNITTSSFNVLYPANQAGLSAGNVLVYNYLVLGH
jgi:hypothetical protein